MRMATSLGQLASAAILSFLAYNCAYAAHDLSWDNNHFFDGVNWQIEPYVGADAFVRNMRFKDEPTHPFQENLDTFQPFVGVRLHKYFGVEVGYQQSEKGTKDRLFDQLQAPVFFGGNPLDLSNPTTLDVTTTTQIKGWNFNLVGYYPICKEKTSLFVKVGYADLDVDQEIRFIGVRSDRGGFGVAQSPAMDFVSLHDSTGMLSLALGLNHNFTYHFGGRVFVAFDRTSRIDLDGDALILGEIDAARGNHLHVNPDNSVNYGVGFYYRW